MKLWHAPTGRLVSGHVLDVSLKPFERALKDYDSQLYVKWNPRKCGGWGCWEIRRRPNEMRAVYQGSHKGTAYFKLMYVENRDVHHVLDAAFLNYDALRKIQEMDLFRMVKDSGYGSFDELLEVKAKEAKTQQLERADSTLRYAIKNNGSAMRDFLNMVRSGIHPAEVLKSTKWV
jgi:hypothetical protein